MIVNRSSQFPYQDCLIPNLPEEVQHKMRDIGNHVVIPLNMLVAAIAFICNGFVIYTVARKRSLQQAPLLMLCSLAVTDLLFALYSILRFTEILTHEQMCPENESPEKGAFSALCLLATLGNLAGISRDRYLAVRDPMWYRTYVTKSRAMKMIFMTWLLSVAVTVMLYLSRKFGDRFPLLGEVSSLLFFLVCTSVIIASYLGLFCKRARPEEVLNIRAILEREKRTANTVGLILLVLLATFLPGILVGLVVNAKNVSPKPFRPFLGCLYAVNGLLNPLLNFGRNKEMRRGLQSLMRCAERVQPT